jgi:hypothetical protein
MLKLKNRQDIIYTALMVCLVHECNNEATDLWSTESNLIDVCNKHYKILEMEKYST